MGYQNVGTPRFYIDYLTYWHSQGMLEQYNETGSTSDNHPEWLGLNPASQVSFTSSVNSEYQYRDWLRFEGLPSKIDAHVSLGLSFES